MSRLSGKQFDFTDGLCKAAQENLCCKCMQYVDEKKREEERKKGFIFDLGCLLDYEGIRLLRYENGFSLGCIDLYTADEEKKDRREMDAYEKKIQKRMVENG